MGDDDKQRGIERRSFALGEEYVQQALAGTSEFTRDFQHEVVTEYAWGACWGRDGVDLRTRSLVTVSILAALGRHEELAIHTRVALKHGCTAEELREALFHVAVYAGVPAALSAFRIAQPIVEPAG